MKPNDRHLAALARAIHEKSHPKGKGPPLPADRIPTEAALCACLIEVRGPEGAAADPACSWPEGEGPVPLPAEAWQVVANVPALGLQEGDVVPAIDEPGVPLRLEAYKGEAPLPQGRWLKLDGPWWRMQTGGVPAEGEIARRSMPTYQGLDAARREWLETNPTDPDTHPAAALIREWWGFTARRVSRNSRRDRTAPAKLAMASKQYPVSRKTRGLFLKPMHARPEEGSQLVFPGFGPGKDLTTPALPLVLYDLGVEMKMLDAEGDGKGRRIVRPGGQGAPLALRLYVEAVLSIEMHDRKDGPVALAMTLEDLLKALYPFRAPVQSDVPKLMPKLEAAKHAINTAPAIPWEDPETGGKGARQVVLVSDLGGGRLQDEVRLLVDLPPGAHSGPLVSPNLARGPAARFARRPAPLRRPLRNVQGGRRACLAPPQARAKSATPPPAA